MTEVLKGTITALTKTGEPGNIMDLEECISIGRGKDNNIRVKLQTVSRVHAQIEKNENGAFVLTNCSETNPTLLNGKPMEQTETKMVLKDGDTLNVGGRDFIFRCSKYH